MQFEDFCWKGEIVPWERSDSLNGLNLQKTLMLHSLGVDIQTDKGVCFDRNACVKFK